MDKEEYLYGAAVQGIQQFIFQTSELKDIIGASELVEQICTKQFVEFEGTNSESIQRAAGQIKHIFNNREDCKKAVLEFPKRIMNLAPGITISQAVVNMENMDFSEAINLLESKLKTQRNKPMPASSMGLMGILRSRKTGLPCIDNRLNDKDNWLDTATYQKKEASKNSDLACKCFGNNLKWDTTNNIEQLTSANDWIAIIHADGNGLGAIVQKIGKERNLFKLFSEKLNEATITSAQEAFNATSELFAGDKYIPMRPIVLGGDDLTIAIRGNIAIRYITEYLQAFERNTQKMLGGICKDHPNPEIRRLLQKGLTACAGISFIKSSYPFYYGYDMAEELCKYAKVQAKKIDETLAPSCIMFHKIQDSFIWSYDDIMKRELSVKKGHKYEPYFLGGPYYLHESNNNMTIQALLDTLKLLDTKEGNSIKSHLRQWITMKINNDGMAKQKLERTLSLLTNDKLKKMLNDITDDNKKSPVYDLLTLLTIHNQITK